MVAIKTVIYLVISLAVAFMIIGTIVFPYLSSSYTSGCKTTWVCKAGDRDTSVGKNNCTVSATENTSLVTGVNVCGVNCQGCSTGSSYESWNTANVGLLVLVFFLAMIGLAVKFIGKI